VLDQPITRERWIGVAGERTRFVGGHGRAGCRPCPSLADAELSCTSPDLFSPAQAAGFKRLQGATRRTSWGGDCYAYGLVALGGIDVVAEPGLKPWDWAALVPIIEGAGGRVRSWRGETLHPDGSGDVIAVGDPALIPQILPLLA
jgi:myo-inositol-1(or 4)-monophosphatase